MAASSVSPQTGSSSPSWANQQQPIPASQNWVCTLWCCSHRDRAARQRTSRLLGVSAAARAVWMRAEIFSGRSVLCHDSSAASCVRSEVGLVEANGVPSGFFAGSNCSIQLRQSFPSVNDSIIASSTRPPPSEFLGESPKVSCIRRFVESRVYSRSNVLPVRFSTSTAKSGGTDRW